MFAANSSKLRKTKKCHRTYATIALKKEDFKTDKMCYTYSYHKRLE